MIENRPSLFGTRQQTKILLLIGLLEETYPREICRIAEARIGAVSKYLDRLEMQGVIVSRYIGNSRRVTINPRFVARKELLSLIERLGLAEHEMMESVRSVRKRPRKRGKAI